VGERMETKLDKGDFSDYSKASKLTLSEQTKNDKEYIIAFKV